MIQNLNQVSFRGFGAVLPEHTRAAQPGEDLEQKTVHLPCGDGPVFCAQEDVLLYCDSGSCVLSVSRDDREYRHYYLDKQVRIAGGVYYALNSLWGNGTVVMAAKTLPTSVGTRNVVNMKLERKFRVDGIYTFFYHEKEQGFLFAGESHPMLELTYVDQGSLHSVADGLDLLLKQGDMVLYGPNQWHMQYADIGVAPRYITISFDATGLDVTPLMNRRIVAPQQAVQLLQQMLREQERMDEFSGDMILAQFSQMLMVLLRQAATPSEVRLQTSNAIHSENEIIRRAQIYVSTHIREKLTVPLVARQVDVSPSYLTALFHKNLQISPGEYIRRIKLQESKQMIRENNLNFTEIAAELQYSTVHHFVNQDGFTVVNVGDDGNISDFFLRCHISLSPFLSKLAYSLNLKI